jgi:hypothetical protein
MTPVIITLSIYTRVIYGLNLSLSSQFKCQSLEQGYSDLKSGVTWELDGGIGWFAHMFIWLEGGSEGIWQT